MCDDQKPRSSATHRSSPVSYDAKRIDVESGVNLIKDDKLRIQEASFANISLRFFSPPEKPSFQVTVSEFRIHFEFFHLAFHLTNEFD